MRTRVLQLLLSFCLWALHATVTLAQQAPTSPADPSDQAPADPSPTGTQTDDAPAPAPAEVPAVAPELLDKARHHFRQAVAFAEAGNCEGAIVEFEASYRMVPRASSLYNIAQCQEQLHRYDLAIRYYERYLDEAEQDADDRDAVNAALRTLRNLLGTVHIASNVPAQVWIDDRLVGSAPGDILAPAGRHILELRADGYLPQRTEIQVAGREEIEVDLTLTKARTTVHITEKSGLDPVVFWSGATATLAVGVVGAVFGGIAMSKQSTANDLRAYDPDRVRVADEMNSAARNADILFAVTGVLAVATTVVGFLTNWDGEAQTTTSTDAPEPSVSVVPTISTQHAGLALRGSL